VGLFIAWLAYFAWIGPHLTQNQAVVAIILGFVSGCSLTYRRKYHQEEGE
jgi:hypothetical protein